MSTLPRPRRDPLQVSSLVEKQTLSIVTSLANDMRHRWSQHERPSVEDYCASHPELLSDPDAALGLIYEELSLRDAAGEPQTLSDLVRRFPQWETRVQRLVECRAVLGSDSTEPPLPECGEVLGEFQLLSELGRGRQGRVFLATEPLLANRLLVLKVTAMQGCEHLSLARLQHTHIVPLYFVKDMAWRGLRVLGMPYFGGASLDRFLERFHPRPLAARSGADFVHWLEDESRNQSQDTFQRGRILARLAGSRYPDVVCWIGACLADALQNAHEKGLVHLDLKPSNVLITSDGQPMLLDFHLARDPIRIGAAGPLWLGGTRSYMSPEQAAAFDAIAAGREVVQDVDERSDLYALGLLLYEMLAGAPGDAAERDQGLREIAASVSVGLADILARCLSPHPGERYAEAAQLASDLRRHLTHRPLAGVPNRSLLERWSKWQRRHPHRLRHATLIMAIVGTLALAGGLAWHSWQHEREEALGLLREGERRLSEGHVDLARRTLQQGLQVAEGSKGDRQIVQDFRDALFRVRSVELAQQLHQLVDDLRNIYGISSQPGREAAGIVAHCETVWANRDGLFDHVGRQLSSGEQAALSHDLLELVLLWIDLQLRIADSETLPAVRARALATLNEAEACAGQSVVLDYQRAKLSDSPPAVDGPTLVPKLPPAATAWESYALGLCLLNDGRLEPARQQLLRAVSRQPDSLWTQFYYGRCLYELHDFTEASRAFSACIALAPHHAGAYYNRAIVLEALGEQERARSDFQKAKELPR